MKNKTQQNKMEHIKLKKVKENKNLLVSAMAVATHQETR